MNETAEFVNFHPDHQNVPKIVKTQVKGIETLKDPSLDKKESALFEDACVSSNDPSLGIRVIGAAAWGNVAEGSALTRPLKRGFSTNTKLSDVSDVGRRRLGRMAG